MLFFGGNGNEFSNLIGCFRDPDFPISAHENGSVFVLLFTKPFKC